MYHEVPPNDPELHNQTKQTEVNEDQLRSLFDVLHFTWKQRIIQVICFFLFLGPLKVLSAVVSVLLIIVGCYILPLFKRFFKHPRKFKVFAMNILDVFNRMLLLSLGIVKINVHGKIDEDARFIVSNHLSLIEAAIYLLRFRVSLLCSELIANWSLMKSLAHCFDLIFVNRRKKENISTHILKYASDPMYLPLLIFPEGKVTNGDAVIGFRTGAFISEYPVQPLAIRFRVWIIPKDCATFCWVEDNNLEYLWQLFCIPFMTVDIDVLESKSFKGRTLTPAEKAIETQLDICNSLGVPAYNLTNKSLFNKTD